MFRQSAFKREHKNTIFLRSNGPWDQFKNLKIYGRLSGILEDYNVRGCEKENFVLIAKEMGMILSEVFPEPNVEVSTFMAPNISIKSPYLCHFRHRVLRCT